MTSTLRAACATLLLLFAALLLPAPASPVISEFLAENEDFSSDEDGDFSDWIEIHNPIRRPRESGRATV